MQTTLKKLITQLFDFLRMNNNVIITFEFRPLRRSTRPDICSKIDPSLPKILRIVFLKISFSIFSSKNDFVCRTTLAELNRTLQDHRRMLHDQVGNKSVVVQEEFWNVTYPKRLLIVTSWRSGSTFLGQMLSEHPGVYNHYEPLMHLGVQQIRPGDPRVQSVVQHLQDLLNCR